MAFQAAEAYKDYQTHVLLSRRIVCVAASMLLYGREQDNKGVSIDGSHLP